MIEKPKSARNRRAAALLLAFMMLLPMLGAPLAAGSSSALEQAREAYFGSNAQQAASLEVIAADDSHIIHQPQEILLPEDVPSEPGAQAIGSAGPFNVGDTRGFSVMAQSSGKLAIDASLVGQGAHTNIWVLNDAAYHAAVGYAHGAAGNPACRLTDVDSALAQDIANKLDAIYERMTGSSGFAAHSGVKITTGNSTMPYAGDLGDDGKINYVLYDMYGDGDNASSYTSGLFTNGDFFADTNYNGIDMLHIDIGAQQGYKAITSEEAETQLGFYGTLAHEFQHMLFYMYFGVNSATSTAPYSWINESLSELAATFFVQDGAEVASFSRLRSAALNDYSTSADFLNFSGTKSYGMAKAFSMALYKHYGSGFTQGVYNAMKTAYPPAANSRQYGENRTKLTNEGHDTAVGNFLKGGTSLGSGGLDTLRTTYTLFMEDFAADGGMKFSGSTAAQTKMIYSGTENPDNLWAIRRAFGDYLYVSGTSGSRYNLTSFAPLPTLASGGTAELTAATSEKLYQLTGESAAAPVLRIAINDANASTNYYVAVPDANAAAGAKLYPLTANGTTNTIITNVDTAYLFVSTMYRTVSTAVSYSWSAAGSNDLIGSVTLSPAAPEIGQKVTAAVDANGSNDYHYAWTLGGNAVGTDSASYTIPAAASSVGKVLAVTVTSTSKHGSALYANTAPAAKAANSTTPVAPYCQKSSATSVSLLTVSGYEYSLGGAVWQDSPVFSQLVPGTQYSFYQRIKATDTVAASASSTALQVTTNDATYEIDTPTNGFTFTALTYGYSNPGGVINDIRNVGSYATGELSIQLSGANASSFTLSKTTVPSLEPDETVSYSIKPNAKLAAGSYSATATISGANVGSFNFDVSVVVNKAAISVTDGTVTAKTYDGTTAAQITYLTFSGLKNNDSLTFGTDYTASAAQFNSAAAGTNKTVTATVSLANTAAANNYTLASGACTLSSKTILPKSLTVSGVTASKVYDGSAAFTNAQIDISNAALSAVLAADSVQLSKAGVTGSLPSANAGSGTLTLSGAFSLTGTGAANYTLSAQPAVAATITQAASSFPEHPAVNVTYTPGMTLADVPLNAGYYWSNTAQAIASAGDNQSFAAVYAEPSGNYQSTAGMITVNVAKGSNQFVEHGPVQATYSEGMTLADIGLPKKYNWAEPDTPVFAGKGQTFAATYYLGDNYELASGVITVHVAKAAAPEITWPEASAITYGQPLSSSVLSGGSTGDGSFAWADGSAFPTVNNNGCMAVFTPNDLNYDWPQAPITKALAVSVSKATASAVSQTHEVVENYAAHGAVFLFWLLPDVAPLTLGETSYTIVSYDNSQGVLAAAPVCEEGCVQLQYASVAAGKQAVITVKISSENYQDMTADLTVLTTEKVPVRFQVSMNGKTYDKQPCAYSGTPRPTNANTGAYVPVDVFDVLYESTDGAGYSAAQAPVNAGAYKLTLSVPADNSMFTGSTAFTFTIAKKQITVTADDFTVKQGSSPPAYTHKVSGLEAGDSLLTNPQFTCNADMQTPAVYDIIPQGADAGGNYTIAYQNGKLTVQPKSTLCTVTGVTSPSGAAVSGLNITASTANSVTSLPVQVAVSPGASFKLYSDAACTKEITNKTMSLAVGDNTAYIKVIAEDGTTGAVYILKVTRAKASAPRITGSSTVQYRGSITLSSDNAVRWEGSNEYVKVTSNGTSATVTSLKNFTKTGSVTVKAYNADGVASTFTVKVKPTFWQWLLIIILFGWIWY